MKIRKYFSQNRILSRREAERYVKVGMVKVNGNVVNDLGIEVDPEKDKIELVGKLGEKVTIAFHKPRGISSSKLRTGEANIFDLLPQFGDLHTIGRLDKESEGLILLSNDGVLANIITGKEHLIEKEYVVKVREKVSPSKVRIMSNPMMLEDGLTLPAKVVMVDDHTFSIVLKEGRNHQIRRMANKVRFTVTELKRVRVGNVCLDNLGVGKWRKLTKQERDKFN